MQIQRLRLTMGKRISLSSVVPMVSRKLIAILVIIVISVSSATASLFYFILKSENATKILDISVYPTINSAGITITYQGDENGNNKASVRFKATVDKIWRDGHPLSSLRELKQLAGSLVYLLSLIHI